MKRVVIAGGGLAGLMAGKLLAERGFSVRVLEGSSRLGGKAGGEQEEGVWREHGYHIFPPWYVNTRPLLDSLGIRLVDFNRWHYLREGEQDRVVTVPVPTSLPTMVQALRAGLFPWYEALLYGYLAVDTLGEPMSQASLLDQVSRIGLMRSRWYVTDSMPEFEAENLLKASAIPAHDMSAMTVKIVVSNWVRSISPFLSILPGDLQNTFIEPLGNATRAAGAEIILGEPVVSVETNGGRISAFISRKADGTTVRNTGDAFMFTTPLEVTRKLIDGKVQALDPSLGNFENLHANPMAALHLDLDRKLSWIPPEHVVMHKGRYGLSFIDVSQHWPGVTNTSLSFISSNFIPLADLTPDEQYEALFGEIQRYLNITPAMVVRKSLKPNVTVPLFINTVGAWPNRPSPRAEGIPNLYFAGDWAKNQVDLACMEGAICSAIDTSRALAQDFGVSGIAAPIQARTFPEAMFRVLKWAMLPSIVPIWAYAKLRRAIAS